MVTCIIYMLFQMMCMMRFRCLLKYIYIYIFYSTFKSKPILFVFTCRSDHLYVFFMQWSPDMYGEGVRGMGQEPGFMVVKKNEVSEIAMDEPITDLNVKEWEVRSSKLKLLTHLVLNAHVVLCCLKAHRHGLSIVLHYGLIHYLWNQNLPWCFLKFIVVC